MRKIYFLLLLCCTYVAASAQLTGTKTIPGTYATLTAAITDLNTQGVGAGGVVFNIAAGYTETLTARLNVTATGTVANPITFQKIGAGANPKLTSYVGTALAGTATPDGMVSFTGSDYVTVDGIDLLDAVANSTPTSCMEYGYGFFKASATDGANNNTVKNCVITLNAVNNTTAAGPFFQGSVGITLMACTPTAGTVIITVTAATGASSNNKFYTNTIQNCNAGIALTGFAAATPFTLADTNNDVGGTAAITGNTIINFGGAAAATNAATGIFAKDQWGLNVSYNSINNNTGSGTNHVNTLRGIFLNASSTSASATCNNNTVTLSCAGTTTANYAIDVEFGSTAASNTISVNNNTVTNCSYSTATTGVFYGIYTASSATTVNANNNTITNNTLPGTGLMYLLYIASSPVNASFNNNTITGNQKTGASGSMYCMYGTTSIYTVTGNTVNNNTIPATSGTASAGIYGFYDLSSPTGETITNNTISNLSIGGTTTSTSCFVYGIYTSTIATSTRVTTSNNVNNLSLGGTLQGTIYGIYSGTAGTVTINKNKIYGLSIGGASANVYGLYATSGIQNINNNIIGDITAPTSTNTNNLAGIYISGGTNSNIYFNTVNINAISSGANFGSSALYTSTTPTVDLRNNILVNLSTPVGTGYVAAYRRSSITLTSFASTSNNNLLYAGVPNPNAVIYYDGTNADQTLLDYKTRVTPRDGVSVTENPTFVSTTGSAATYLHINTTVATRIESGGTTISGIADDFDGQTRSTTNPDLGADEFTGVAIDVIPPAIIYTALANTCSTTDRVLLGVIIADYTGIPTTGTLVPRVYYNKNGGTWYSKPGTLASGTATNSTWNFTIVSADMGGVIVGDVVNYYVLAQDIVATPNVGSSPSGTTATNVNTVSSHTTTPNSYAVGGNLSGTYTVGSTGTYTTLTAAVNAYNSACLTGPVTFSLTDFTYAAETLPITINANPFASATNTLTIRPAASVAAVISGTTGTNLSSIIKLNGADYVTINGINTGGSSLTLENTSTTAGTAVVWLSSLGVGQGATNNTIKNVNILAGITQNTSTSNTYGIVIAGNTLNATITSINGGDDNDNNTIESNTITRVRYGIYTRGISTTNPNLGTIIKSNIIGPTSFGADEIGKGGIVSREEDGIIITQNEIRFVGGDYANNTTSGDFAGITLATDASWPAPTSVLVKNASVTRNLIHDVVQERTYAASAIILAGADGTNVTNNVVANNMIYNILSNGTGSDQLAALAINAGKGDKVVYNSIYLLGDCDASAAASAASVSGFGITVGSTTPTDLVLRNNNVFLDVTSSSTPTLKFAAINIPTAFVWGAGGMNYNNWYFNAANTVANLGCINGSGGTFYTTLPAWQTAVTQDANSKTLDPLFVSATDLHVGTTSPLDNQGTPITGITIDYDGNTRNAATPDIGADEFNNSNCTGSIGGTATTTKPSICSGDSSFITVSGFSIGSGSTYQWQISTDNSIWSDIAGQISTSGLNTSALTVTRYYRLKVTCTSGTALAYSTVVTITVKALPTVSVSPTGPISLCSPASQLLSITATNAASPSYQWVKGGIDISGEISNTYNASISGNYAVKVTSGITSCTVTSSTIVVAINATPTAVTVTPSSASLCATTNPAVLLTASGGTVGGEFTFGTQAAQNIASGYPAPYSVYYGGQRMQTLITAAELTAQGVVAGPISSINFPVVSFGANWGSTLTGCTDFQISIGATPLTSLTTFQTGLTQVLAPYTFVPTVGYNNTQTFGTPFTWDGTSNLIIETTFSNAITGTTADGVIQYNSPTTYQSTIVYRADGVSSASIASGTTVNLSFNARPDFKLVTTVPAAITWSPITELFTNAAATTPYASGAATINVYAKPTVTRTYTATATIGTCTSNKTVTITSNCSVPVTLLSFYGNKQMAVNNLFWNTATEQNCKGFELERSADGVNFSAITFVESKAINGNSNSTISYNFSDVKPFAGNNYYRLKQLDKDGKISYSQIVLLKGNKSAQIAITALYPNPVTNILNLVITTPTTDEVTVTIMDIAGKVLSQKIAGLASGDNIMQFDVSKFAAGTYVIKATCQNGCDSGTKKFVKD